jgi:hypothetical protein
MHALVVLQAADGSWSLTADLANVLGRELSEIKAAAQGAVGPADEIDRAWATALALAWLEQSAADRAAEWQLLAAKARAFLDRTTAVPPEGWTWSEAALEFVREASKKV